MFDNTGDFGDSLDAQEEIAEITKTANLAKFSMNNSVLKQCYQRAASCPRIPYFLLKLLKQQILQSFFSTQLKQCYQPAATCPRIGDFFKESLSQ